MNCSELENINISLDYFNSIKNFSEEVTKYIKGYKQIEGEFIKKLQMFQINSKKKLTVAEDSKTEQIITSITCKICELIEAKIELFKISNDTIDLKIKEFDNFIKETSESIKVAQKESTEIIKVYFNSNLEMDKVKKNYIDSLSKTEDLINKYYSNQYKIIGHENGLGQKLNDSEYTYLKERQKNEVNEMENAIKESKQIESLYANAISSSTQLYTNFMKINNSFNDKIKKDTCELSNKIKSLIVSFMLLYKNTQKQPSVYIDTYMNQFNLLDEVKEMDKIITNSYKNDKLLKNITPIKYKLKSLKLLKEANYLESDEEDKIDSKIDSKIDNKIDNNIDNYLDNNKNALRKQSTIVLEDGLDKMKYISDESLVITIKCLFDNFTYIDKGDFNITFEEKKNKTQQYILKIIKNMNSYPFSRYGITAEKKKNPKVNVNVKYKRDKLSSQQIKELKELLDNHHNRLIFLQKLNDYRSRGNFYLCKEDYNLLGEMFNQMVDKIKRDEDYHCAERIIILSETYSIDKGKKKVFLQETIKNNALFKDKSFWKEFINYTINKQIVKTTNRDKKRKENKESTEAKIANLVFAQLLTLIDNMYKFEMDSKLIKEVIDPIISKYKLSDSFQSTINEIITSKELQKSLDEKEREKEKKEEEEDEKENDEENKNVINDNKNKNIINDKKEGKGKGKKEEDKKDGEVKKMEEDGWEFMDFDKYN